MTDLFRKEALHAQQFRFESSVVFSSPPSLAIVAAVSTITLLLIAFAAWGIRYTRHVQVAGMIVPNVGIVKIRSPQVARIVEMRFKSGANVKKGDVLFVLTTDRTDSQSQSVEQQILFFSKQRRKSLEGERGSLQLLSSTEDKKATNKIAELSNSISSLEAQIKIKREKAILANDSAQRHRALLNEGYVSTDQYQEKLAIAMEEESAQLELAKQVIRLRSELKNAHLERKSTQEKFESQREQLARSEISADQEIIETAVKHSTTILSPYDGVAINASIAVGQTVEMQQVLVSLLPNGSGQYAELFIPTSAIGFIKPGNKVYLKYDAYPFQKFGQYEAEISAISPFTLPLSEISLSVGGVRRHPSAAADEAYYVVNAKLQQDYAEAYGNQYTLTPGATLAAEIAVEERRIVEWLFEPLFSGNKNKFSVSSKNMDDAVGQSRYLLQS